MKLWWSRLLYCTIIYIARIVIYLLFPFDSVLGSWSFLTEIALTLQELLDIRSVLNRADELGKTWILLQSSMSILHQVLVMADLVDDQISIRDLVSDNVWARLRQFIGRQMRLERLEEVVPGALLVLGVSLFLVWVEEGDDE